MHVAIFTVPVSSTGQNEFTDVEKCSRKPCFCNFRHWNDGKNFIHCQNLCQNAVLYTLHRSFPDSSLMCHVEVQSAQQFKEPIFSMIQILAKVLPKILRNFPTKYKRQLRLLFWQHREVDNIIGKSQRISYIETWDDVTISLSTKLALWFFILFCNENLPARTFGCQNNCPIQLQFFRSECA